jgi:hypothetical protein
MIADGFCIDQPPCGSPPGGQDLIADKASHPLRTDAEMIGSLSHADDILAHLTPA